MRYGLYARLLLVVLTACTAISLSSQELALSPKIEKPTFDTGEPVALEDACAAYVMRADSILKSGGSSEDAMVEYRRFARCSADGSSRNTTALLRLAMVSIADGYYLDALNTLDEISDKARAAEDTAFIGIAVQFMGDTYLRAEDHEKARHLIDSANTLAVATRDSTLRAIHTHTVAAMLRHGLPVQGMTTSDSISAGTSVTSSLPAGNFRGLVELNSAILLMDLGYPGIADYYLKRCIASDGDREILRDGYWHLASLSKRRGDFESAYNYLAQYSKINNDLLNAKRQEILGRLRIQMETYKHREEITELTRDKNIATIMNRMQRINAFSLLVGSIVILVAAYFTIRNYQKRLHANQVIHEQNEEINTQRINDLENNLKIQSMNSMIVGQEAERERIARELHDSLGGLLSTIKLHFDALQSRNSDVKQTSEYTKAYSLLDEACTEVRNISNNMQPGALLKLGVVSAISDLINRLQGEETPQIDYQHFDVQDDIDQTTALNIYRIVQELLNNSIKHAGAGHILVQLVQKEDELIITVEDDGKGYDPETITPGMGTQNIASRVNYLKGDIHVHSVAGEGTSTLITLPV